MILDKEKGSSEDPFFEQELAHFLPIAHGRLLDIGCLDGSKTVLVRNVVQAAEAYGVDFIPNRLAEAERRGIHTFCVDLNNDLPLPFPDEFFDVIFCGEVIEHLFSPDTLMDEIVRLLKPGGYVLITTPNLASWKNRFALLMGWQPFFTEVSTRDRYGNPRTPRGLPSGHIRIFTPKALQEMTAVSRLRVEHIITVAVFTNSRGIVSQLGRFLDRILIPVWPTLGDRIVLRARKS